MLRCPLFRVFRKNVLRFSLNRTKLKGWLRDMGRQSERDGVTIEKYYILMISNSGEAAS